MLTIRVLGEEFWDPTIEEFIKTKPATVRMEHSLISISKWEAHWEKPFLPAQGRVKGMSGYAEEKYYISCMIIGSFDQHIPGLLYQHHLKEIKEYIDKKHTATTIHSLVPERRQSKIITSELIYYWMIKFGIAIDCQTWHLNRLLTLINVCSIKNNTGKGSKMSHVEAAKYRAKLNKARREAGF